MNKHTPSQFHDHHSFEEGIRAEELYRTKDGELHPSIQKAEKHITDEVCEELDRIIEKADKQHGPFGARATHRIVLALAGDIERARNLHDILHNWIG